MSDAQFTILIGAISAAATALVAALKWSVGRVTKSNDAGTAALIANTASNAVLISKIDELADRIDKMTDVVFESTTGATGVPQEIRAKRRARTNPLGTPMIGSYRAPRSGSHHDEDD